MHRLGWAVLVLIPTGVFSSGVLLKSVLDAPSPKDRFSAILYYGEALPQPILVDDAMKADFAGMILGRIAMRKALPAETEGRPCIRLAVFTKGEWAHRRTLPREELRPEMAANRYWFYPTGENAPPLSYRVAAHELVELPAGADTLRIRLRGSTTEYLDAPLSPDGLDASPCPIPSAGGDVPTAPGASATAAQQDRNLITREQIEESGATNAYDVIRRVRSQFLQRRRVSDVTGTINRYPMVYVDGMRRGDSEEGDARDELERIPADQIEEIRYLSGPNATTRFGTGHSAGAILVVTRR